MSLPKKVVMLGHFGVGKTSLVRRYVDSAFNEDYLVTVGVQVKKKDVKIASQNITLIIWDVEGNHTISKTRTSYLLGAHGFLYVFDVTRSETFEDLATEIAYLKEHYPNVPFSVVGNKYDLIENNTLKEFFSSKEAFKKCTFTSAKIGDNVENIFLNLTEKML